jgi:hypothetical protein
MVSPMSVDAWRRDCEAKGVAVARVARGLQRRSSECVSDMASVWCGQQAGLAVSCAAACATARFKCRKVA